MRTLLIITGCLLAALATNAQPRAELYDFNFLPTRLSPYFYVETEKQDSLWHRQAYYLSTKSLAMEGWYKDEECTVPDGTLTWYHQNKRKQSEELFVNGKPEGNRMGYHEDGSRYDSSNYLLGRQQGTRLRWYAKGSIMDSIYYDAAGYKIQKTFKQNGRLSVAGSWLHDTLKQGKWTYYHEDGKLMATEIYADGKKLSCNCYDENGIHLPADACTEKKAEVKGGPAVWRLFLENTMREINREMVKANYPSGNYEVPVRFLIELDGSLSDLKALSAFGNGLEEAVLRMFENAPRWTPGRKFGKAVRAYRTQPVIFVIQ